jgi:hypothetical protein
MYLMTIEMFSEFGILRFDQKEIVWGDNLITEINAGLSKSFMGIVVLSNNFFHRQMPQLELDSMIFAMTVVRFSVYISISKNVYNNRIDNPLILFLEQLYQQTSV